MLDCYSYKTPQVFCKYTSEKLLKFLKYDGYILLQLYKKEVNMPGLASSALFQVLDHGAASAI